MGKIVGVDLHIKRPSIICVFENFFASFIESENEVEEIIHLRPEIVVMDAPLSIEFPFRRFERELMRFGYKFLPLSMRSMRALAEKAIEIKKALEKKNIKVFETHPGSLSKKISVNIGEKDKRDSFICAFMGFLYKKGLSNLLDGFLYI